MRRYFLILCVVGLLTGFSSGLFADTVSYHWSGTYTNTSIDVSDGWHEPWWTVMLDFPNGGWEISYPNGRFEYDDYYPDDIESFTITVKGKNDNSEAPIDLFLDFNNNHYDGFRSVGGYNVALDDPFTLALDIRNGDILYNGIDVGNLRNVGLDTFFGRQSFYLGIGCHFTLTEIDVDVSAGDPVPEPGSLILLGTGIAVAGLVAKRRKK